MDIRPFRGWLYNTGAGGDISSLIAPPYDILSLQDKQNLLAGNSRNIVAVDMPHCPPKELGPDEVYHAAAATLDAWKADGTLRQDDSPAIYIYDQSYTWAGKSYTRRAILCGVRVTRLGKDIIPHEHTFAGPKADRLRLTELTEMQLSPIFGFNDDPGGKVARLLAAATAKTPPALTGKLQGVGQKLWKITDGRTINELTALLKDVPVFIADGHHRCTTAMNYRDALLAAGRIDENHEANFVMFALVAKSDPGLLILPTHRLVSGLSREFSLANLRKSAAEFDWQQVRGDVDLGDADAFLSPFGRGAIAFVGEGDDNLWVAKLRDTNAMKASAPDKPDVWRKLDVAILQMLIMDKALKQWRTDATAVQYTPDGREAVNAVRSGQVQLAVCLQGTPLQAVENIALAGESMPHKSTYFYPKLATGVVLKPLT